MFRKSKSHEDYITDTYRARPKGVYVSLGALLLQEGVFAPMAYINGCKKKEWFLTDFDDMSLEIIQEYCQIMSDLYPHIDKFLHIREEKGELGDVLRVTCLVDLNPESEANKQPVRREKKHRRIEFRNPVLRNADKKFQQKNKTHNV